MGRPNVTATPRMPYQYWLVYHMYVIRIIIDVFNVQLRRFVPNALKGPFVAVRPFSSHIHRSQ